MIRPYSEVPGTPGPLTSRRVPAKGICPQEMCSRAKPACSKSA